MQGLRAVDRELRCEIRGDVTNDVRAARAFARATGIDPARAEGVLADAMNEVFPRLERHFAPIEGASEFLAWARERYTLVLATNPVWREELVRLRLKWAGIDPSIFKVITHAGVMHACKPAGDYYRETLERARATPDESLLVGNEYKMDLPATRVGIPVYIVLPHKQAESPGFRRRTSRTPDDRRVPAWQGSFGGLRRLLEERGA
jgi:FMN phosphatase YigB (HAD superfamily)